MYSALKFLFLACLLICCPPVQARMYQWNDPDTGTTQFSGKPPPWYRSGETGPRVFVFEYGRIIDDTAIEISDEGREALRRGAFIKAEENRETAKQKALKAEELKSTFQMSDDPSLQFPEIDDEIIDTRENDIIEEDAGTPGKEKVTNETVEKMKTLIKEWEDQQTQIAKEKIQFETDETGQ